MENFDQILDSPVAEERKLQTAGFWIRVAAYLIDAVLYWVIVIAIAFTLGAVAVFLYFFSFFIFLAYFSIMESSSNQATIGKMAVGIKVGDRNGNQISFGNALGRYFAKILSGIILGVGFMMAGWDEKNQALHDKLADTYVFYK